MEHLGVHTNSYRYNSKPTAAERIAEVARDDAIRSLLRTEIISINHKSEEKGFIPIYNLENITDMYRSYKALGGNGAITEIYNKVLQLPQNPPDVENRGCNKCL